MRATLTRFDPMSDFRTMDAMFERLFGGPTVSTPETSVMPIAVYEKDNKVIVKASVPGIDPNDIEVSVENNILTIRGEFKQEDELKDAKVYRREYAHGSFSRSVRLPDKLDIDHIDAEFKNGLVTVSIPEIEPIEKKPLKVPVRTTANEKAIPANASETTKTEKTK